MFISGLQPLEHQSVNRLQKFGMNRLVKICQELEVLLCMYSTSAIRVLGRRKDEAHRVAHSSIRVLQLACVNNIPDKCLVDIYDPQG